MSNATTTARIDVNALRVGMYIHLDLGWMAHPFPLSSFRIASLAQIDTIRSLGLKQVRWDPAESAVDVMESADEPAAAAPAATNQPADEPVPAAAPAPTPAEAHARRVAEEAAALRLCERQYTEAASDCRRTAELVLRQPTEAAASAQALSRALLDKMLPSQDLCIRLLADGAGDRASQHALNVTIVSLLMGRSFGLDESDLLDLAVGAMLHDIGKAELPTRLRHREDDFTAAEARAYEDHVARGVALGRKMMLTPGAMLVIAQHHEHADGTGFPMKLNADRMSPLARIVAIVNRYDRLCNPQLISRGLTPHEALSLLFAQARTRFDASILGAFIKMMGVYPPGSTVQLTDDRYAIVVGVNASRPLKPRVLVHEPGVPREQALPLDLETSGGLGIRRSVKPLQLPPSTLGYLSPRKRMTYYFDAQGKR